MMQQIIEFFSGLFDTSHWPARWHCGYWSDFHGWLYIFSDLAIWLSYFMIPVIIIDYFVKKRKNIKFHKVYFLFAAFILLCGITHFMDAVMFWVPMYRLNALIRLITAVASLLTAYYLIRILPRAFQQKTSGELETEIQRRIDAEQKLEEANKSLNNFAFMAAHDLQEPLRKISLYGGRLEEGMQTTTDPALQGYAQKMVHSSRRLQQLTRDLLNLAVLDQDVELQTVYPSMVIGAALEDLHLKILEKHATIEIGNIPPVPGNERYLRQLFFNLIGNALKFCERPPLVSIIGYRSDGRVFIDINDNGIGMNEENIARIFEPFQRLNLKTAYEGSGIGLAICKKIMDIHHGSIRVRSEKGVGSIFTLDFPASAMPLTKNVHTAP
jgi:two-component system, chemotaxis family, sensor kinase Cph1